jgi:hypothetical protein
MEMLLRDKRKFLVEKLELLAVKKVCILRVLRIRRVCRYLEAVDYLLNFAK